MVITMVNFFYRLCYEKYELTCQTSSPEAHPCSSARSSAVTMFFRYRTLAIELWQGMEGSASGFRV